MPDKDEAAEHPGEDQAAAAERLERALERIAVSAHRVATMPRGASAGPIADAGPTREVAARLDALIAQLRTALDRD